jgi:CheY-like chemotaxis protein/anti-sigma regulatory factor (Ser/Thr protein kinase)
MPGAHDPSHTQKADTVPVCPARTRVLVVEDSPTQRRLIGQIVEECGAYTPVYACDGEEALQILERERPAVILTDVFMPRLDGLALVRRVRERHPLVPVVLMTAMGSEELALQALRAGASSYIPKRCLPTDLAAVLAQILAVARLDQERQKVLGRLRRRESEFVLDNDTSLVPAVIALLQEDLAAGCLCDGTGLVRCGVALAEALLNAIQHGNLEVRSDLREQGHAFQDLARQRCQQSPYRERRVTLRASLGPHEAVFVIRDEGPGFNVASLPDPTDPANIEKASGRGLLLIRTFMDEVRHNSSGNEITLVKRRDGREGQRA